MSLTDEVKAQLAAVDSSLTEAEKFFKILDSVEYDEVASSLGAEDRARYDLTVLYAINSLFWMLKRTYGEDPQSHGIKAEMDRIKERMVRLKEIKDRAKMPRVDTKVAERIVRHGLNLKKKKTVEQENWENERMEEDDGAT